MLVVAGSLFTIVNGGAPELKLGPATIGVGGFLDFLRVTSLGLVLIGLGAVISWTTQVADIAPAVALLCRPLRVLRVPVDDWAVTISLAFRMFPMLSEEFRLLAAARRLQPPAPEKPSRRAEVVDLCTAAMVVRCGAQPRWVTPSPRGVAPGASPRTPSIRAGAMPSLRRCSSAW